MTRGLYCSLERSWSFAPIAIDCRGPSKFPLAWLTFDCPMAERTSSIVRPYDERAVGLTWTRTAGFCPPLMETSPTPGSCEIFCAKRVSAKSSTFERGMESEVRARVRIGASAGFVFA